jgi:hypothetical protein
MLPPVPKELEGQGAGACGSAAEVPGTRPVPAIRSNLFQGRNAAIRRQESIPMRQLLRMAWSAMNAAERSSTPPPPPVAIHTPHPSQAIPL